MSLYLPEQKLGSHSTGEGSSNKFVLKGRQTGAMHRGHTWVFRAESHDTMMAWYEDIKALTEKTPEERSMFVRHHSRSLSQSSRRSASSDGLVDEDDDEPFSAGSQIDINPSPKHDAASRRSQPGGRFPSDIQVNAQRGLQAPHSPSSLSSGARDQRTPDAPAIAVGGSAMETHAHEQDHNRGYENLEHTQADEPSNAAIANEEAQHDGVNPYTGEPGAPSQQPQEQSYHRRDQAHIVPVVTSHDDQKQRLDKAEGQDENHGVDRENAVVGGYPQSSHDNEAQANGNAKVPATGPGNESEMQSANDTLAYITATGGTPSDENCPRRPTANTTRDDSVNTMSSLHVPGGYPHTNIS